MKQRVLIIRHGETDSNAARILQTPDIPLSERGQDQAQRLARRLAGEHPSLLITSDYQRAMETSRAIVSETQVSTRISSLLRERNFGAWRGRRYDDLDFDPFDPHRIPPGGESWEVFYARVAEAYEMICALSEEVHGPLVVVTHGLVCRALTNRHLAPDAPDFEAPWANTSVTEAFGPPWELVRVNCAAHLEGDGEDVAPA